MASWPYDTSQWKRLREAKLAANPTCEACERRGLTVPARDVDHIVAINRGGPAFPGLDGLRALCHSCHSSKTARLDRSDSKHATPFKGCDLDGNPLWPDDGWEPGASQGRRIPGWRPSGSTKTDLVFANDSHLEVDRWV